MSPALVKGRGVRVGMTWVAFVDAGWLRERGAAHHGLSSAEVAIRADTLYKTALRGAAAGNLLRTYVYDGEFGDDERRARQQREHDQLADEAGLRLRLGRLVDRGERKGIQQKGVDTLLVLDMLQMAQAQAYDAALLFAGDGDFTEVVDAVQRLGRLVYLWNTDELDGLSRDLRRASDGVRSAGDPVGVWPFLTPPVQSLDVPPVRG